MAVSAELLCAFQMPGAHEAVSAIIRRRSTHAADIREVALAGVDLSRVRSVLDLGCGFGFMVEAVAPRLPAGAVYTGVEACETNREPFLRRLAAAGCRGEFLGMHIEDALPWPDDSFDLVLCSYSLYFFPGVLPAVARVLKPEGMLLAVTHSTNFLRTIFPVTGVREEDSALPQLIDRFPAERAGEILRRLFDECLRTDYPNRLRFEPGQIEELLLYIQFKLPLLVAGGDPGHGVPARIRRAVDGIGGREERPCR